jgi:hypothetical protein
LVIRHGDQARGLAPGVTFATSPLLPLAPDVGAGRTAFRSLLSGVSTGGLVQRDRRRARADPPRRHASTGTRSRHHTRLPVSVPR